MKKIIYLLSLVLAIPNAFAELGVTDFGTYYPMMGMYNQYGMMGGIGMGFFGLIWFSLASFLFSVIFWLTYNWLAKIKKR